MCESVNDTIRRKRPFGRFLSFLHTLILLHGLSDDCGRGLGAVAYLRIGRGRADGSPSLTARQTHSHADHRYQYK